MCSPSWTPSLLLPHTIPLGHPSAPAPSMLYPASNLDWQFVSYMMLYMFQCHSPKSFHPLSLPQSPKDSSIHLCLFCCLPYVNETTNVLWNLPFFKMVLPKTNFSFPKTWAENTQQTSIPVNCFLARGNTPCTILSQKCILWEKGLVKLSQPWGVSLIWWIAF